MKNTLLSLFVLSIFLSNSCSKEDPLDKYYWGEATATKNGMASSWSARPRCVVNKPYNQGMDIIMDVFNSQGFKRENLFFYKIPNEVGNYDITKSSLHTVDSTHGASYGTLIDDGDVAGDSYYLIQGIVENKLTIDKKKGNEIWGTFQAAFVKDKTYLPQDPTAPDTVIFTNGKFHTKLLTE